MALPQQQSIMQAQLHHADGCAPAAMAAAAGKASPSPFSLPPPAQQPLSVWPDASAAAAFAAAVSLPRRQLRGRAPSASRRRELRATSKVDPS